MINERRENWARVLCGIDGESWDSATAERREVILRAYETDIDAVMKVADSETQALRATVERVRDLLDGEPLSAADVRAALEG